MIKSVFRQMSPEEIEIEGIEDIKMIHIYDLTGADRPDGKYGVTGVLVDYGDNKQLNYTENDYCFGDYVNKIFEAYNISEEKKSIIMDDITRQIMEAGEVPSHDGLLNTYYEAEKMDDPLIVNASTLSKRFCPLIEYLVVGLYKTMGSEPEIIDRKSGWRGAGRLILRIGGVNRTVYFKVFEINDSMFSIKLNGFLTDTGDLLINISLYDDEISITYNSESSGIEGSSDFKFSVASLREMHQIKINGELLFYDVNIYENSFSKESRIEDLVSGISLEFLPANLSPCAVYSLPMGLKYILYDVYEAADQVDVKTFCGVFLWQDANCADIRGWSVIKSLQSGHALRNEAFKIIKMTDNREYIQISFLSGTGSRYKKELEGKYVISER